MRYSDTQDVEYVAVRFVIQNEDGRRTFGTRMAVPVLPDEVIIKPVTVATGNVKWLADVDRYKLLHRLETDGIAETVTIGWDRIELMTLDEVEQYVEQCARSIAEHQADIVRLAELYA